MATPLSAYICDIWTQLIYLKVCTVDLATNLTIILTPIHLPLLFEVQTYLYNIFVYGGIYWGLRIGVGEIGHKTILLVKNVYRPWTVHRVLGARIKTIETPRKELWEQLICFRRFN